MILKTILQNRSRVFAASSTVVILLVLLSACASKWSQYYIHYSKVGSPAIESIYDIGRQYYENFPDVSDNLQRYFIRDMNYMGDDDVESLKKVYRLSLYFKIDYRERDGKRLKPVNQDIRIIVASCKNNSTSLEVDAYRIKYPSRSSRPAGTYGVHLQIEKLKKEGIITGNPETQEAICLFNKGKMGGEFLAPKVVTQSNNVVYTADEINELVREYEALR